MQRADEDHAAQTIFARRKTALLQRKKHLSTVLFEILNVMQEHGFFKNHIEVRT